MKLNLKDYQKLAKRTCPSLGSDKLDLAHMTLGIFSEYEEYANATDLVNASEESIDAMWYVANYCTFRGYSLEELETEESIFVHKYFKEQIYVRNNDTFFQIISRLQDFVKKYIAYNKPIDTIKEQVCLVHIINYIKSTFENQEEFEKGLFRNIEKLKVRYPADKFTEENALNRNLEEERKVLEQ